MKAVGTAQHLAGAADRQGFQRLQEQLRQFARLFPAESAALQGIRALRLAHGGLLEVGASGELAPDVLGALARRLDRLGRGRLGNADEDVRQLVGHVHAGAALGVFQEVLDLAVGDGDAVADLALQQLLDGQLVAQLVAVGDDVHALLRQRLAEFLGAEIVAPGHGLERPVHVGFADADAGLGGELQLQALQHHAFEQLFPERRVRRRGDLFQLQLLAGFAQPLAELAVGDDIVVDDGHDAIELADRARRRG